MRVTSQTAAVKLRCPSTSLVIEVLELGLRLLLGWRDVAELIHVDVALSLQLLEEGLGVLVLLLQVVEAVQLLLRLGDEGQLGLDVGLAVGVGFLGGLDLLLRAATLAGLLQHVGRYTFGVCNEKGG